MTAEHRRLAAAFLRRPIVRDVARQRAWLPGFPGGFRLRPGRVIRNSVKDPAFLPVLRYVACGATPDAVWDLRHRIMRGPEERQIEEAAEC